MRIFTVTLLVALSCSLVLGRPKQSLQFGTGLNFGLATPFSSPKKAAIEPEPFLEIGSDVNWDAVKPVTHNLGRGSAALDNIKYNFQAVVVTPEVDAELYATTGSSGGLKHSDSGSENVFNFGTLESKVNVNHQSNTDFGIGALNGAKHTIDGHKEALTNAAFNLKQGVNDAVGDFKQIKSDVVKPVTSVHATGAFEHSDSGSEKNFGILESKVNVNHQSNTDFGIGALNGAKHTIDGHKEALTNAAFNLKQGVNDAVGDFKQIKSDVVKPVTSVHATGAFEHSDSGSEKVLNFGTLESKVNVNHQINSDVGIGALNGAKHTIDGHKEALTNAALNLKQGVNDALGNFKVELKSDVVKPVTSVHATGAFEHSDSGSEKVLNFGTLESKVNVNHQINSDVGIGALNGAKHTIDGHKEALTNAAFNLKQGVNDAVGDFKQIKSDVVKPVTTVHATGAFEHSDSGSEKNFGILESKVNVNHQSNTDFGIGALNGAKHTIDGHKEALTNAAFNLKQGVNDAVGDFKQIKSDVVKPVTSVHATGAFEHSDSGSEKNFGILESKVNVNHQSNTDFGIGALNGAKHTIDGHKEALTNAAFNLKQGVNDAVDDFKQIKSDVVKPVTTVHATGAFEHSDSGSEKNFGILESKVNVNHQSNTDFGIGALNGAKHAIDGHKEALTNAAFNLKQGVNDAVGDFKQIKSDVVKPVTSVHATGAFEHSDSGSEKNFGILESKVNVNHQSNTDFGIGALNGAKHTIDGHKEALTNAAFNLKQGVNDAVGDFKQIKSDVVKPVTTVHATGAFEHSDSGSEKNFGILESKVNVNHQSNTDVGIGALNGAKHTIDGHKEALTNAAFNLKQGVNDAVGDFKQIKSDVVKPVTTVHATGAFEHSDSGSEKNFGILESKVNVNHQSNTDFGIGALNGAKHTIDGHKEALTNAAFNLKQGVNDAVGDFKQIKSDVVKPVTSVHATGAFEHSDSGSEKNFGILESKVNVNHQSNTDVGIGALNGAKHTIDGHKEALTNAALNLKQGVNDALGNFKVELKSDVVKPVTSVHATGAFEHSDSGSEKVLNFGTLESKVNVNHQINSDVGIGALNGAKHTIDGHKEALTNAAFNLKQGVNDAVGDFKQIKSDVVKPVTTVHATGAFEHSDSGSEKNFGILESKVNVNHQSNTDVGIGALNGAKHTIDGHKEALTNAALNLKQGVNDALGNFKVELKSDVVKPVTSVHATGAFEHSDSGSEKVLNFGTLESKVNVNHQINSDVGIDALNGAKHTIDGHKEALTNAAFNLKQGVNDAVGDFKQIKSDVVKPVTSVHDTGAFEHSDSGSENVFNLGAFGSKVNVNHQSNTNGVKSPGAVVAVGIDTLEEVKHRLDGHKEDLINAAATGINHVVEKFKNTAYDLKGGNQLGVAAINIGEPKKNTLVKSSVGTVLNKFGNPFFTNTAVQKPLFSFGF